MTDERHVILENTYLAIHLQRFVRFVRLLYEDANLTSINGNRMSEIWNYENFENS